MKIVIFGLSISSSWGNGHATLWRGVLRSLARMGHDVVFYEKDTPYYAAHRDLHDPPGYQLRLYDDWSSVAREAALALADADLGMITSYCPDAVAAARLLQDSRAGVTAFYDLDAPMTLAGVSRGESVFYLPEDGLSGFDLVLSYTGGAALDLLRERLGARRVLPLYGSVDPDVHRPPLPAPERRFHLSYLGTFAADRQEALEALFLQPATLRPDLCFSLGGALYPWDFPWRDNVWFTPHVAPADHPEFYASSTLTLNVTRRAMADLGWCPSGRLFEAAACGAPVLSDSWEGLDTFFTPGEEILLARSTEEALAALGRDPRDLAAIAARARQRTLDEHTAAHRARELVAMVEQAASYRPRPAGIDERLVAQGEL